MVEYLYDAIRAVAGMEVKVNAFITDENEQSITENCFFVLHEPDGDKMIASTAGTYLPENLMWEFIIPEEITKDLKGRYWYCIQHDKSNMCFKQPIYLV